MLPGMLSKIILAAVTFAAIFLLANTIMGGAASFSNALMCSFFAGSRHTWESLCLDSPIGDMCVSESLNFEFPLVGCGTNYRAFPETTVSKTADTLAQEASSCWGKFGSGEWNILWAPGENPSLCASFFSNLNEEMSANDITTYLEDKIYGTAVQCTDTALCCEGELTCDEIDDRYCSMETGNPYLCGGGETRGRYHTCDSGYQEVSIAGFWDCMNKIPDLACPEPYDYEEVTNPGASLTSEPCEYGTHTTQVSAPDIFIPFEGDPPTDPRAYACKLCKDTTRDDIYTLPQECTVIQQANPEVCTIEITYADYLKLGTRTYFSFKRSGETGFLVPPDDETETVTGQVSVFVEYLDSFTGTRKSDEIKTLPPECAAGTFIDSCNGCLEPCLRSLVTFGYLGFGGGGAISKIGTLAVADFKYSLLGLADPLGVMSCLNCLSANAQGADLLACDDKLLICVYQY